MPADLAFGSRVSPVLDSPHPGTAACPSPALSPEAAARWRALLERHWRARLERVTELSLAYHDAQDARIQPCAGSLAVMAPARPLLRQAVAERRALAEIEAALSRLASGSFGRCGRCGAGISVARLTRTPQVRDCDACAR